MKAVFYQQLQDDFIALRHFYIQGSKNQEQPDRILSSIRNARKKIAAHSAPFEKKILLYCIDTLFDVLKEGNAEKTADYTDAIHNIPEIYMQKRNLYSFQKELKSFRKKYGKHYFPFIDEVKPHFTKKAPKNKWKYFFPESDEDFKRLHPVGYRFLVAAGITVLFVPMLLYMAVVLFINPAPNEWPVILGLAGAFVVGTGFFNIVAAIIHQYLGHLFTAVCLLGGSGIVTLALYLLYT